MNCLINKLKKILLPLIVVFVSLVSIKNYSQDKNGLVERRWQSLTKMAPFFLTEAKLRKKFWFWAICEANLWLNILPTTQQQDGTDNSALMSTPHFKSFGVKLDRRILFSFGCIGAFCSQGHDGRVLETLLVLVLGSPQITAKWLFALPLVPAAMWGPQLRCIWQRPINSVNGHKWLFKMVTKSADGSRRVDLELF